MCKLKPHLAAYLWFMLGTVGPVGASIVGEDDREIYVFRADSLETKLANRTGPMTFDGADGFQNMGSGQLLYWNDKVYLVGSAHVLYDEHGQDKLIGNGVGIWSPNAHLREEADEEFVNERYYFDPQPLNAHLAQDYYTTGDDVAIFELRSEHVIHETIEGRVRGASHITDDTPERVAEQLNLNDSLMIAHHFDFENYRAAVSRTCRVMPPTSNVAQWLHNCDTGLNSSGSGIYLAKDDEVVLVGIHVSGRRKALGSFSNAEFASGHAGNRFVPANTIQQHFKLLEEQGIIPSSE